MNYANIKYFDIADGEGVRTSLFVSGCRRGCKNCFNSVAWDFAAGALIVEEAGGAATALDGSPLPIAVKSSVFCSNAACASERAALYAAASPLPAP